MWAYAPDPTPATRQARQERLAQQRLRAYVGLDVQAGPPGPPAQRRDAAEVLFEEVNPEATLRQRILDTEGADGARRLFVVPASWPRVVRRGGAAALLVEESRNGVINGNIFTDATLETSLRPPPMGGVATFIGAAAFVPGGQQVDFPHFNAASPVPQVFSVFADAATPLDVIVAGDASPVATFVVDGGALAEGSCRTDICLGAFVEPYADGWMRVEVALDVSPATVSVQLGSDGVLWWPQLELAHGGAASVPRASSPIFATRRGERMRVGPVPAAPVMSLDVTVASFTRSGGFLASLGGFAASVLDVRDDGVRRDNDPISQADFDQSRRFQAVVAFGEQVSQPLCAEDIQPAQCASTTSPETPAAATDVEVGLSGAVMSPKLIERVDVTAP